MKETMQTVPVLLDQMEASKYLGVSHKWLERDRWMGPTIPYLKVGRSVRYKASDIVDFLEKNMTPTK